MYVITRRNLPLSVSMSLSLWVYVCLSLCVYNLVHLSLCKQTYFSQNWNHAIYLVLYLPLKYILNISLMALSILCAF